MYEGKCLVAASYTVIFLAITEQDLLAYLLVFVSAKD